MKKAYQADLVFIGNQDYIPNGIVEVNAEGIISHIGNSASSEQIEIEKKQGFICPGFINTHCHLELSHLKGKVSEGTELHGFVQELQQFRAANELDIENAIKSADAEMTKNGIVAVGDISNGTSSFDCKQNSTILYHSFIELFGFDSSQSKEIYTRGIALRQEAEELNLCASVVPHSPYSVSNDLMKQIGETKNNSSISIHNQETKGENEMFQNATGSMINMLNRFGLDLSDFNALGKNSIYNYLPFLNPDVNTLLVHNTYTTEADMEWASSQNKNIFWCFCPNANLYIEKTLPNLPSFLSKGLKCTLGTDSIASNWQLSIWAEIESIQKHFPNIKIEELIEMACQNGAEFLGINDKFGRIEIGKKPGINWVNEGKVEVLA